MNNSWRILYVDDDLDACTQVKEVLEGEKWDVTPDKVNVEAINDFSLAMDRLESQRFDLVILDVRLGPHDQARDEEAGAQTLLAIKSRRFVPVVFYTALPNLVKELQSPLVKVVVKEPDPANLIRTIGEIFSAQLPVINRALMRHFENVQREYMWGFVAENWEEFLTKAKNIELAYLLARRLSLSLARSGILQLMRDLGDQQVDIIPGENVHPMEYYIIPPLSTTTETGDLFKKESGEYIVVLTPSCDMVERDGKTKAELVLVAHCTLLKDQREYGEWQNDARKGKALEALLSNNRQVGQADRFHFLPGIFDIPDLLVDFQKLEAMPSNELNNHNRIASLDSPFAESLATRFVRFYGRVGTPDLDLNIIIKNLKS